MEGKVRRVLVELPPSAIRPNPRQPREIFEEEGLRQLSASIRRVGILQPLTVRKCGEDWELVAGERRRLAGRGKRTAIREKEI